MDENYKKNIKDEEFSNLRIVYTNEQIDKICKLFDGSSDDGAGDDQWKINGLALLLSCLENYPEENTTLGIPILCKIQALEAAYQLGKNSKKPIKIARAG